MVHFVVSPSRFLSSALMLTLLLMGLFIHNSAWSEVTPQQVKQYAQAYPYLFNDTPLPTKPVPKTPIVSKINNSAPPASSASPQQKQAIKLLLQSFNGETSYQQLAQVLSTTPANSIVVVTPPSPNTQSFDAPNIIPITHVSSSLSNGVTSSRFAQHHISESDYQAITLLLVPEPQWFEHFWSLLDKPLIEIHLLNQLSQDAAYLNRFKRDPNQQRLVERVAERLNLKRVASSPTQP